MDEPILAEKLVSDRLSLLGVGVVKDCFQDYSVSPADWYLEPPGNSVYVIYELRVVIVDGVGITENEYANLGVGLTNGLDFKLFDASGTIVDLTDGSPVKTNADYKALFTDVEFVTGGTANDLVIARWDFRELLGGGVVVDGGLDQRIGFTANDNFTAIGSHRFYVRGWNAT